VVVESGRFRLQAPTTDPAFLRLRIQEGVADHISYVDGVPPTAVTGTRNGVGPDAQNGVPVYEAAVSVQTASQLDISLGDELFLIGDPGDPLIGRTQRDVYAFARITGVTRWPIRGRVVAG